MAGDDIGTTSGSTGPRIDVQATNEDRTWGMLSHLSGFLGYLGIVPFASVIGPLVIWLLKKDQSAFVDEHGKEALNFQLTMSIAYAIALMLCFVIIGFFILPFLGVWLIVLVIIAAIKANNGERFRYPLTIRFVK